MILFAIWYWCSYGSDKYGDDFEGKFVKKNIDSKWFFREIFGTENKANERLFRGRSEREETEMKNVVQRI